MVYVPGLKKNLVSITVLEYCGYDVNFSKGKVFLRHIATGQGKKISVQVKNLYDLEVQSTCKALMSKTKVRGLVVEREHELPLNMQPQRVVQQPQLEKKRGDQVEASTQVKTSSRGEF